jgi:hypothetical protein
MTHRSCTLALALFSAPVAVLQAQKKAAVRFEVSFPAAAHAQPITGRAFVIITRSIAPAGGRGGRGGTPTEREPRAQISQVDGVPFAGKDIEKLAPGAAVVIDDATPAYPVESLRDIPDGEYYVQAVVNIYSEFRRSDGHVVWMHDDQWEGQHWTSSPGNLYSKPQKIRLDASKGYRVQLVADQVMPPVVVPPDTKWVKRIKIQSPSLTKFWGRPIYIGATVLLPRDYETSTISYPVLYSQGHFGLGAPMGFAEGNATHNEWVKDNFPRMVVVTWQHPSPYYDDSYAVNSANNGPYGDALLQELVPELEKRFRLIKQPWGRTLAGGSTGGWEAAALQIFYPDFFAGSWVYCPDPVTFHGYEGVDIYQDDNAFYKQHEWYRVPTPNIRDTLGHIKLTFQQKAKFEYVAGPNGRSGHQLDVWSSVFSPVGKDGFYQPLFDPLTGVIDKNVMQYWKEHYDLMYYMQAHWATLGPKLVDKLHFYVGDMDTYQLDEGVFWLDRWMRTTSAPHYASEFTYGDRKPHCWSGPDTQTERLKQIAEFIVRKKPEGVTTPWWKY